jgi:hypothetical protein
MTGVTTDVGGDLSKSETAPLRGCPPPAKLVYDSIKNPQKYLPKLFTMSEGVCIIELTAIHH